jgi:hypothetical protein
MRGLRTKNGQYLPVFEIMAPERAAPMTVDNM